VGFESGRRPAAQAVGVAGGDGAPARAHPPRPLRRRADLRPVRPDCVRLDADRPRGRTPGLRRRPGSAATGVSGSPGGAFTQRASRLSPRRSTDDHAIRPSRTGNPCARTSPRRPPRAGSGAPAAASHGRTAAPPPPPAPAGAEAAGVSSGRTPCPASGPHGRAGCRPGRSRCPAAVPPRRFRRRRAARRERAAPRQVGVVVEVGLAGDAGNGPASRLGRAACASRRGSGSAGCRRGGPVGRTAARPGRRPGRPPACRRGCGVRGPCGPAASARPVPRVVPCCAGVRPPPPRRGRRRLVRRGARVAEGASPRRRPAPGSPPASTGPDAGCPGGRRRARGVPVAPRPVGGGAGSGQGVTAWGFALWPDRSAQQGSNRHEASWRHMSMFDCCRWVPPTGDHAEPCTPDPAVLTGRLVVEGEFAVPEPRSRR
jgi:hypothetical protein